MIIGKVQVLVFAALIFAAALLGGCGQKGDLYLPDRLQQQPGASGH